MVTVYILLSFNVCKEVGVIADVNKKGQNSGGRLAAQKWSPGGKLTAPAGHPTKIVNKADKQLSLYQHCFHFLLFSWFLKMSSWLSKNILGSLSSVC